MLHDDGDEEDLDENEVLRAISDLEEGITSKEAGGEEEEGGEGENDTTSETCFSPRSASNGDDHKTLWPTVGVRSRWIEAVRGANTTGEIAFALQAFSEHCRGFGLLAEDLIDNGSSQRVRMFVTSSSSSSASPHGSKRRHSGSHNRLSFGRSASGRALRAASSQRISYRED